MGFAVTLVATRLSQRDAILAAAGVAVTAEADPDLAAPVSAGVVGDHFVLWRNMRAFRGADLPDGAALSAGGKEVLVLNVVDTVGAQDLRCYRDGAEVWTCAFGEIYDPMLHTRGPVPLDARAMVRDMAAADGDADKDDDEVIAYGAEVPGRIFERIVGLYHEDMTGDGFHAVSGDLPLAEDPSGPDARAAARARRSNRPWWKLW